MKTYLKGFLKGFAVILLVIVVPLSFAFFMNDKTTIIKFFDLYGWLVLLFGYGIGVYLILKNHLPRAWIFVVILLGIFSLPLLLGYIEKN